MIRTLGILRTVALAAVVLLLAACGGGGGGHGATPSSSVSLTALVLEQVTLVPAFSPTTLVYSAEVPNSVASTRVTPTALDPTATVRVNGTIVASGTASPVIALAEGDNTITITVTSPTGTSTRTYRVDVSRLPPPSSNARVASLWLSDAALDQIFDPTLTSYTASVGYLGTSTRVVAVPEDANASLALNGIPLAAGVPSNPVPLSIGSNALTLLATAEDATTTRSYEVAVSRGDLAAVQQEAYVKASNAGPDRFGASLALSASTLAVGAPDEDSNATGIDGNQNDDSQSDAGAAYLFDRLASDWSQTAYVKASNTDSGDRFGGSVDLDGDRLAVGAVGERSRAGGVDADQADDSGTLVGAVYAFERNDAGTWQQTTYIKASNPDSGDEFGGQLSLYGGWLLVGALGEQSAATGVDGDQNNDNLSYAGAAYLFGQDSTGAWRQRAYLKASNTESFDEFGRSVAISADTLAVGAWGEDSNARGIDGNQSDNSQASAGAVYLFDSDAGGTWSPGAYVKASNTEAQDFFGIAVALDGDLLAVGASGEDSAAGGINGDQSDNSASSAGAVYVFERDATGQWAQAAYLKASNPRSFDAFGSTVELNGNLLAVGATGQSSMATGLNGDELDQSMTDAGATYLFERSATGEWAQIAFVKASNTDAGDEFGGAIGVDGDTLAAGSRFEQSASNVINQGEPDDSQNSTGAVYVFR